jgi:hypothetical protein
LAVKHNARRTNSREEYEKAFWHRLEGTLIGVGVLVLLLVVLSVIGRFVA